MNIQDIIRAWRDSAFRESLSEEQRALLPANPIGEALNPEDLLSISGGMRGNCCTDGDLSPCSSMPSDGHGTQCPTHFLCL